MNLFGERLTALMQERGIRDIPELVERLREQPSYRRGAMRVEDVETAMKVRYVEEWPPDDVFNAAFFYALAQTLSLSKEELESLYLALHHGSLPGEPPESERPEQ